MRCGRAHVKGFSCLALNPERCTHPHVGCREIAYELSHALNVCRGTVHCRSHGMQVDGQDCGFLGPPDVACSEYRAAHWTGRCDGRKEAPLVKPDADDDASVVTDRPETGRPETGATTMTRPETGRPETGQSSRPTTGEEGGRPQTTTPVGSSG